MAVILNGATGGIQLTSSSGGTMSVNPPATATSYIATLPAATGTLLNSASSLAAASLTGTVPTARLGSGTASSSTFLAGDQTYKTISSGGVSLLGAIATTSGTSVALTSVNLSLYNKVYFNFDQVSPATGSSILRISINGAATLDLGTAIANDRALFGELMLDLNSNVMNLSQSSPSGTPLSTGNIADGANEKNFLYQVQTDLTSLTSVPLTFTWSTGHAFDNGRILVYGLK